LCALGKEEVNRFQMRSGHGKNVGRSIDLRDSERLTAKRRDIDSALSANVDCMYARRLTPHRMHAGRIRFDVLAIAEQTAEKSQGHGTAANVAGADKKNVFHDDARRDGDSLRQSKIKRPQVNEPA